MGHLPSRAEVLPILEPGPDLCRFVPKLLVGMHLKVVIRVLAAAGEFRRGISSP